jgi:4-hydroxy-tetrahydrodipicolinate reductase
MKVGLFGFGRTGRLVAEEIIKDNESSLVWIVRKTDQNHHEYASDSLGYPRSKQGYFFTMDEAMKSGFYERNPVDVIIDFSSSLGLYGYANAADSGIHIVSAISHYEQRELEFLMALALKTAVLHSANITLGINFLLVASQILKQIVPDADIEVIEEHFRQKRGVSGSALKIAEKLGLDPDQHINSIRVGGIVGKHEVVFGLPTQTIRITHDVISRGAFGAGALFAARSLMTAKPGFYTMEDLMRDAFIEKIAVQNILV